MDFSQRCYLGLLLEIKEKLRLLKRENLEAFDEVTFLSGKLCLILTTA